MKAEFEKSQLRGKSVRMVMDQKIVKMICLDDICAIMKREIMIRNGKALKICPTVLAVNDGPVEYRALYVEPFDITRLISVVSQENRLVAGICQDIEAWMAELPLARIKEGKENPQNAATPRAGVAGTVEMDFNGFPVSFKIINNYLFVNATQMAKIFNINIHNWLRSIEVQSYRKAIVDNREFPSIEGQIEALRGSSGGTWVVDILGILFARSMSEEFYDWYMKYLREIFPQRYNAPKKEKKIVEEKLVIPEDITDANKMIKKLHKTLVDSKHKVEFYDDFIESRDWYKTTLLAEELQTSPWKIHQFLFENGIIVRDKKQWVVKPQHQALQVAVPYLWTNPQGKTYAFGKTLRWTKAGREYILELWREKNPIN